MPIPGKMSTKKAKMKEGEDDEQWMVAGGGGRGDELMSVWKSKEICVTCMRRVNSGEKGLTCDICRRWFHKDCENVSKKDYEILNKSDVNLKWFCGRCVDKIDDMKKGFSKMEARLNSMEEQMQRKRKEDEKQTEKVVRMEGAIKKLLEENAESWLAIRGDIERVKQQVNQAIVREAEMNWQETNKLIEAVKCEAGQKQEKNLKTLKDEMEKLRNRKVTIEETEQSRLERKEELEQMKQEVLNKGIEEIRKTKEKEDKKVEEMSLKIEEIEKERKKKNIVMFNLEESAEEEAMKRYKEDLGKCAEIFAKELEIQDLTIEKVIRIGKKSETRNRPLLIKLGSETDRVTVLGKAKKLRYSEKFVKIYISKDMTESEREKDRKLREELKERRSKEEGASFVIRRGRVMELKPEGARKKVPRRQDF